MQKKMILIDANSLIHRAFHALPPFKTGEGELVNAVFGFCSMLLTVISRLKPDYIAATFDLPGKTFRHKAYKDYKATRVKAPDELYEQFERIREILSTMNIPVFQKEGYEADDLIATIAEKMKAHPEIQTYIVTGDKDAYQLIDDSTYIFSPKKVKGENIVFTPEKLIEKTGLAPDQIVDFKALTGDPSDNIPGVAGIGIKTGVSLLKKYGTLDNVYNNLDEIKGALHKKLKEGKEDAYASKKLVELVNKVPVDFDLNKTKMNSEDFSRIIPLFEKLNFSSLVNRIKKYIPGADINPDQSSLF
jgi:DNA polymerase-1